MFPAIVDFFAFSSVRILSLAEEYLSMSKALTILILIAAAVTALQQPARANSPLKPAAGIDSLERRAQDSTIAAAFLAIARDSNQVSEYQKIIGIYKSRKQPEQELKIAEKMLASNPGSAAAYFTSGDVQLDNSEPEQAIEMLQKALKIDPNFVRAHTVLAEAYLMMNSTDTLQARLDTATALAHLDTALNLNPRYAQAYLQRAALLTRLGRHSAAVEDFQVLSELLPDDLSIWLKLSRALSRAGMLEESADALKYAVSLDPKSPDALYRLAEASVDAGRYDEGMHAYEKFMLQFPTDPRALEAERKARAMGGGRP